LKTNERNNKAKKEMNITHAHTNTSLNKIKTTKEIKMTRLDESIEYFILRRFVFFFFKWQMDQTDKQSSSRWRWGR